MSDVESQVMFRANKHVNDVIPTQARREHEVEMRRASKLPEAVLINKMTKGKTSTP